MNEAAAVLFSVFIAMKLLALTFCICIYCGMLMAPEPNKLPWVIWKPLPTIPWPPEEETPTDCYRF
jgi:hypothetical protein